MNVVQALPRRMQFNAHAASSVELCVAEWISASRHRATTTIVAEPSDDAPLLDVAIARLRSSRSLSSLHLAWALRRALARRADVIVTQQHIPTAARIALGNPRVPVVLQTHNYIDPPAVGRGSAFRNWVRRQELSRLAGITLVSDAVLAQFNRDWPDVTIPRTVVTNGFDFSKWFPSPDRQKLIMVVGRNQPEKGIFESATGVAAALADRPDWCAAFVLSAANTVPGYMDAVKIALAPLGDRCQVLTGIPFAEVKAMTERAALAVVASRWNEPFGRTALEAHAGGAALISSGTGGLRQISGDAACYLDVVNGEAIAHALVTMMDDEAARKDLATRAMARVRTLFPLNRDSIGDGLESDIPVGEKLDSFIERIVQTRSASRA